MSDAQEPAPEGGFGAVAIEAMEGAEEGLLRHVLGLLVGAHQASRHTENDVAVALDEALEVLEVTAQGARTRG